MKRIFLAAICTLTALSAYGQAQTAPPGISSCTLNVAQAPAVRGVKLGMTVDELLALFPGSAENQQTKQILAEADGNPRLGAAFFGISPAGYSTRERYAGISSYGVQAFDRRIVGLYVNYEGPPNGPRWTNVDDLTEKFVESFKLPGTANWLLDRSDARRGLQCHGFQVFALISGDRATLMLIEPEWVQTQKARLAAYEEQKRREFKP
jgi:hypothetical protein